MGSKRLERRAYPVDRLSLSELSSLDLLIVRLYIRFLRLRSPVVRWIRNGM